MARGVLIYFHGTTSAPDSGPSDEDVESSGMRLVRHVRPGYDGVPPAPQDDLCDVARAAVEGASAEGLPIVAMGWSGGGPYAWAAGAIGHPAVVGIVLLGAWAPMDPPDPGLPPAVRLFMRLGRHAPRPVLRGSLAMAGFRTPGHLDDVRRIARPWGFTVEDVAARAPVAAWHAEADAEVPIGPWLAQPMIDLTVVPGRDHAPRSDTWRDALT